MSTCMVAILGSDSSSSSSSSSSSTDSSSSSSSDGWDCPPPPSPPAPAAPPPGGQTPVCLAMLMPSDHVMECASQAGSVQILSSDAVLATLLDFPPATSNCSAGKNADDVALTFPCYQTMLKSVFNAAMAVSVMGAAPSTAVCPSTSYVCNCLATIATKCPALATELLAKSPPSPSAPPGCVASSLMPLAGLSASCTALNTMLSTSISTSFATSCSANYVSSKITVLTTAAATTAPAMTPIALSANCSATLGMPVATAKPVSIVSAAISLSGYTTTTFTPVLQLGFVTATANLLNVAPADVKVTGVTNAPATSGRRLSATGVVVAFTVAAPSTASAATLSTSIGTLSTTNKASYATALQSAGMTQVTAASITSAQAPTTAAAPAQATTSGAARALASGAAVAAAMAAAALF
jgi:hypothetical protein